MGSSPSPGRVTRDDIDLMRTAMSDLVDRLRHSAALAQGIDFQDLADAYGRQLALAGEIDEFLQRRADMADACSPDGVRLAVVASNDDVAFAALLGGTA